IPETQQPISTLTRPIIRKPRSLSVPPVIQQPFIQTTNQQIRQVTPTYIRSHIQPSISSYIPQTIQQPFLQTTNQQVIPTYTPS
ncbi:unnamed protein product, partial [Rotaria sp. Silwood1]